MSQCTSLGFFLYVYHNSPNILWGTKDRLVKLMREWKVATTCSGCGTFEMALRSVANAFTSCLPVDDDPFEAI